MTHIHILSSDGSFYMRCKDSEVDDMVEKIREVFVKRRGVEFLRIKVVHGKKIRVINYKKEDNDK